MITINQKEVADAIHRKKAIEFGAFKLKLHETNPSAPLSPFYINIRNKENPKPGPLDENDYALIAHCILETISKSGFVFDAIAPIPRAGDPIVDAIEKIYSTTTFNYGDFRIIRLAKEEKNGLRKIIPLTGFEYREGERVLLIDDLVTKAGTKIEAIKAVESQGAIVVGLVVFIDRQQGGKEELERAGYKLIASLTITDLLHHYQFTAAITNEKYFEAIDYISKN